MPSRLRVRVKTSFGEMTVEADSAKEALSMLETLSPEFMDKVEGLISSKLTPPLKTQLKGLVEFTTEGPVVTTRSKLTHYEAIGLVLCASEGRTASSASIERLLLSSGVRSMVPARLNEMTKRGVSDWILTSTRQGHSASGWPAIVLSNVYPQPFQIRQLPN